MNWKNKEEVKTYNKQAYKRRLKENSNYNKEFYLKQKDKKSYIKSHNKARNKWNERNPEKRLAQIRAYDNIKIPKGQLCQICNKNKAVERHHEDYSKPLEIMFLCFDCHRKIHLDTHRHSNGAVNGTADICVNCGHSRKSHWNAPRINMFSCRVFNCDCKKFKPIAKTNDIDRIESPDYPESQEEWEEREVGK